MSTKALFQQPEMTDDYRERVYKIIDDCDDKKLYMVMEIERLQRNVEELAWAAKGYLIDGDAYETDLREALERFEQLTEA